MYPNTTQPAAGGAIPQNISITTPYTNDDLMLGNAEGHDDFGVLIQTPLQLGQTLIIYHPHAQQPPEIVDTTSLALTREPKPLPSPISPWAPFASRNDFEQAELFIKHNCTNGLINDQLQLNQKQESHHHHLGNLPLMKNARDLHKILKEAESNLDMSPVCSIYQWWQMLLTMRMSSSRKSILKSHLSIMELKRSEYILSTVDHPWMQYWMLLKILTFTLPSPSTLNNTTSSILEQGQT